MKGQDFEFTMTKSFSNSEVEIFVQVKNFTPERPAPACSNPSSPLYSDSGDSAEFEDLIINMIIVADQGKVFFIPLTDDLFLFIQGEIIEEVFKRGEKHYSEMISGRYND
jgi:hypothetical protein